jgi:phage shock protein A
MPISDAVILQLVQTVAGLESKVEAMTGSMGEMKGQIGNLTTIAQQAQGFSNAAKAMWTMIGLMLGAGGTELVQKLLAVAP